MNDRLNVLSDVFKKKVFNDLGAGVLKNAWEGFNASLFAYGQTGSGKSYSVVGYPENKGKNRSLASESVALIADFGSCILNRYRSHGLRGHLQDQGHQGQHASRGYVQHAGNLQ